MLKAEIKKVLIQLHNKSEMDGYTGHRTVFITPYLERIMQLIQEDSDAK